MKDEILTTGDSARRLNLSADRVRQLEREGKLPALKTRSGQRLFKASDVDRLAKQMGNEK
jgi:excisionase family DNA binding protein